MIILTVIFQFGLC